MNSIEYFLEHKLVFANEVGKEGVGLLFHHSYIELRLMGEFCEDGADLLKIFLFGGLVEGEGDFLVANHVDVDASLEESLV